MLVSRRTFLAGAAGLLTTTALAPSALAQEQALRLFWWGSQDRADRTFKVADLFAAQHPGWDLQGEFLGFSDYTAKLSTMIAGGNAPDVIQTEYRFLFDYARRGTLAPLDSLVGSVLDVSDFASPALEAGKVDGQLFGIPLGLSALSLIYDETAFERYGVAPPTPETTWEQQAEIGLAITEAARSAGVQNYYGLPDEGGGDYVFEVWVTQRGGLLYTADGKLGFTEADLAEWLAYWDELRKSGACVPPDLQALNKQTIETMALTLGYSPVAYAVANQLIGFQAVNQGTLSLTMAPRFADATSSGQALRPSQFFSLGAGSQSLEQGARFIDFFTRDPEAAAILGVERGVPPSAATRDAIAPQLDAVGRKMVDYISLVTDRAGPTPPPPPAGATEVAQVLRTANEEVGFGQKSAADAARDFMSEANSVLSRG